LAALFGLGRRCNCERAGFRLYGSAVAAAREPFLYRSLGVADTLDGRFDLVCLHAFMLVRRLRREAAPGPALAQAVFDAMFSDMDVSLREMGVGDLSVGRRMRAMWEAFNGRALAYDAALATGDAAALETALMRNVWRGTPPPQWTPDGAPDQAPGKQPPESCAAVMARLVTAQVAYLDGQGLDALAAGEALFLSPAEALP
jgi:cytochrome b pre-mRNA-processing protein 3